MDVNLSEKLNQSSVVAVVIVAIVATAAIAVKEKRTQQEVVDQNFDENALMSNWEKKDAVVVAVESVVKMWPWMDTLAQNCYRKRSQEHV